MWLGETYLPILWLRGCNYSDNLDGRGLGNGRLGPDISSNQSDEDISRAWGLMPVNTPSHDHALAPGQVMTAWVTRGRISREFYRTHKTMAQLWLALPCHGDNMRGPTRQRHILSIRWMLISTTSDSFPFPVSFLYPVVALFTRISSHHHLRCQLDDWMTLCCQSWGIILTIDSLHWAQTVESQFLLLAYFNQGSQRGSIPNLTKLATARAGGGSVTLNNGHLCVREASLLSIRQSLSLNSLSKEIILIKWWS